ncbi:ATP-binding protein [Williamsia muralis]|uniref:ATP-binding protein n=1 Tax=Williamsia marianensis TaxID=85044 RepID=UPI00382B34CC
MTADAELVFRLAGGVTVTFGGREADPRIVGGPRCALVLGFLVVNRHRDVSLEELAEAVWPADRPQSWNAALRILFSRIRDTFRLVGLPADGLRSRSGGVRLTLPASLRSDLELAEMYCDTSVGDPQAVLQNARKALGLLISAPLDGITGSWADHVRAEATRIRIKALEIDAEGSLRAREYARATHSAQSIIAIDPFREKAYRIAMSGYMALGERGQALAAAARCRQALAEELGTTPSAETENLYLEILRSDDHPTRVTVAAATPSIENNAVRIERTAERVTIDEAVIGAAHGRGQFIAVVGEAGTGKTTLVLEAMDRARAAGTTVLFGRCSEESLVSFEPFVEAIGRELDDLDPVTVQERLRSAGPGLVKLVPQRMWETSDILVSSVEDDDRALTMSAVLEWLTSPMRRSPTMLVVDDLHWASTATLDVLRFVIHGSESAGLTIIVTVREEFTDRADLRSVLISPSRTRGVQRIELGAFDVAQVAALVEASGSDLDPAALHDRTGGLPFFVSSLLASDALRSQQQLPTSVAESVAHRIRVLGADALELLEVCSVIGLVSPRGVLRSAVEPMDDGAFAAAIDELSQARLITEFVSSSEVMIRHALVQESVYVQMPGARRVHAHSRVARAFEDHGVDHEPDGFARMAYHLSHGLDSDRPRSVEYSIRAGDAANSIGAYEDAVSLYQFAAERLTPRGDSSARCRLLIKLGRAQRKARNSAFRSTLLGAAAMGRRLGDVDLHVSATLANNLYGILYVHIHIDHERIASLNDALHALEATGRDDGSSTAHLLAQLAIEQIWTTDHHTRRDLLVRAIDAARAADDTDALIAALSAVLVSLRTPHMATIRQDAYEELEKISSIAPTRTLDPMLTVWLARAQVVNGELAKAQHTIGRVSAAHTSRDRELGWLVSSIDFGIALAAGRLSQCDQQLEEIRSIPASPIETYSFGRLLAFVCGLRTLRGDMREIVDAADDMTERFDLVSSYRPILALAMADVGDVESAARLLSWYDKPRVAAIEVNHVWASSIAVLGRVAAQIGNTIVCEAVYDLMVDHADETISAVAVVYGVTHHHLADLSIALGQYDRARRHLDDALRVHRARGFDAWYAETLYLDALLAAKSSGRHPTDSIERARRAADDTGATAVRRRIDALAGRWKA